MVKHMLKILKDLIFSKICLFNHFMDTRHYKVTYLKKYVKFQGFYLCWIGLLAGSKINQKIQGILRNFQNNTAA